MTSNQPAWAWQRADTSSPLALLDWSWARLELPDDEYIAVMAIQAADDRHAVHASSAGDGWSAAQRRRQLGTVELSAS